MSQGITLNQKWILITLCAFWTQKSLEERNCYCSLTCCQNMFEAPDALLIMSYVMESSLKTSFCDCRENAIMVDVYFTTLDVLVVQQKDGKNPNDLLGV